jgi:glycosyltransferase involved in cell wall biosynthesis
LSQGDLILTRAVETGPRLLFIEPYANASHRALVEGLMAHVPARWTALSLPGRHFRWRLRGAACFLARQAADVLQEGWDGLICSSMLNLAELKGLCPALAATPALVYFHENQLCYPASGQAGAAQQERDLFLAFSNLTSAQAARMAVFNSAYHRDEFLGAANELLARLPDAAPAGLVEEITRKSRMLPVPLETGPAAGLWREARHGPLRILWNHRWSQDKDPEVFCAALMDLAAAGLEFEVAVLGPSSGRPPRVMAPTRQALGMRVRQWGAVLDRREYWRWLFWADVVVSSARQEYFGLSVAEAAWAGCRPLLPDALVYPTLYPAGYLYEPGGLGQALRPLAADPALARGQDMRPLALGWTWQEQAEPWALALEELCGAA